MGAISEAIAKEARSRGVEITTGAEVIAVRVKGGRVSGVALKDGTEIEAGGGAGAANPKPLLLKKLRPRRPPSAFPPPVQRRPRAPGSLRIDAALPQLPAFSCPP